MTLHILLQILDKNVTSVCKQCIQYRVYESAETNNCGNLLRICLWFNPSVSWLRYIFFAQKIQYKFGSPDNLT